MDDEPNTDPDDDVADPNTDPCEAAAPKTDPLPVWGIPKTDEVVWPPNTELVVAGAEANIPPLVCSVVVAGDPNSLPPVEVETAEPKTPPGDWLMLLVPKRPLGGDVAKDEPNKLVELLAEPNRLLAGAELLAAVEPNSPIEAVVEAVLDPKILAGEAVGLAAEPNRPAELLEEPEPNRPA